MLRTIRLLTTAAGGLLAIAWTPAGAQVLDAVYRGTLVCDRLPFTSTKMREAIEVTVADGKVHYSHVVRLRDEAEPLPERGTGTLDGRHISLRGSWEGGGRRYEANYSGTFVRRSARLKGTQVWSVDGRIITRACSGAIKRPLKPFLPPKQKPR